jgi:hypothetical protein
MDRETPVATGEHIDGGNHITSFAATVIVISTEVKSQGVVAESGRRPKHRVHHKRMAIATIQRVRMADHEGALGHGPIGEVGSEEIGFELMAVSSQKVLMFHAMTVP